ncbi:MAG: CocE/NonD family hydrolase [Gemmatimonadaceae bacterium]
MRPRALLAIQILTALFIALPLVAQERDGEFIKANYTKHIYDVAMRDGVKLHTIVYVPNDAAPGRTYPMVMQRTCYSIAPYGANEYPDALGPNRFMMRDKYIMVYQDVRGRFMSEGKWMNVRPIIDNASGPSQVDEATDTYDTIDWLLKNIPNNNGRVGQWGISYPGFFTTAGILSRHPALKAASPQAPVTDFYFEDFHHNGALTQGYFYTYPVFGVDPSAPTPEAWFGPMMVNEGRANDYDFQLKLGALKHTTEKYYENNYFWQELVAHPNYDAHWQARAIAPHLNNVKTAVMTVGGWYDAEDLYGPLKVYKTIEQKNPGTYNTIVMGPFRHGGWSAQGVVHTLHGDQYFGDSLETKFQRDVETPFFAHFLKGAGDGKTGLPEAFMFDTGKRQWERFDRWPAANAQWSTLALHEGGRLALNGKPSTGSDAYLSDPNKPVPGRCVGTSIEGFTMYQYMSDDQRCFSTRPDVLTYETEPLTEDVTLAGEIRVKLKVASTGTDADFVVKLVDVFPPDAPDHPYMPNKNVHMAGYQAMVRNEIMRARWRDGFDKPKPMVAGTTTTVPLALQDVLHTFKKGHRLMIQIQSSMFPIFDRNPQTYVPNIYKADDKDFRKATQTVYRNSSIEVQILKSSVVP